MAGPTAPPEWVNNNKGKVQSAFDRAQAAKQEMAGKRVESEQVKRSAPGMKLTPNGPMRASPDRQAHIEGMKKDDAAAKQERARQLNESIQKSSSAQKEKGRDARDR